MRYINVKMEETLLPMIYAGSTLQEVVDALENLLDMPLRFSEAGNVGVALHSRRYPSEDTAKVYQILAKKNIKSGDWGKEQIKWLEMMPDNPVIVEKSDNLNYRRLLCWVTLKGKCFGHITMLEQTNRLEDLDQETVKLMCRLVALSCLVNGIRGAGETADDIFFSILSGEIVTHTQLLFRTHGMDFPEAKAYRILLFPEMKGKMAYGLKNEIRDLFPGSYFTVYSDRCVVLLAFAEKAEGKKIPAWLYQIARKYSTRIIWGETFDNLLECAAQFRRLDACISKVKEEGAGVTEYDSFRDYGLFFETGLDDKGLLQFCCPAVQEMYRYDREKGTEYLDTLAHYIRADRNTAATGKSMNIHPNTVAYRISRMQELFDFDINESDTLYQLMLSLRLCRYAGMIE